MKSPSLWVDSTNAGLAVHLGAFTTNPLSPLVPEALVGKLRALIESTRRRGAQTVNSELIWLHWQMGLACAPRCSRTRELRKESSSWTPWRPSLTAGYGRDFGRRNLYYMMRFAEVFPDTEIVHALRAQLSWTYLRELIAIDDPYNRWWSRPWAPCASSSACRTTSYSVILTFSTSVDALFAGYERKWLPQQGDALDKIRSWVAAGECVALTCFEREPSQCHRPGLIPSWARGA